MNVEVSFLTAISAAPADDGPRLVFADWLDERAAPGDREWAEFIRVSLDAPEVVFGPPDEHDHLGRLVEATRAAELAWRSWDAWTGLHRARLAGSPLRRWLGSDECRFRYRRGMVAEVEATHRVVSDALDDLFLLGPVETLFVPNLPCFGHLWPLRRFLDRPSLRVLRLEAGQLGDNDADLFEGAIDWIRSLVRVELIASERTAAAFDWLAPRLRDDPTLGHVTWRRRQSPLAALPPD